MTSTRKRSNDAKERLNDDVSERNAADKNDRNKNSDSSESPDFPKNKKDCRNSLKAKENCKSYGSKLIC